MIKFCLIHLKNIYEPTLIQLLPLLKELQTNNTCPKNISFLTRTLTKNILFKRTLMPLTLSNQFKLLSNKTPEQHEINNIENLVFKSGYQTEIIDSSNHVCRVPDVKEDAEDDNLTLTQVTASPVAKKIKLDNELPSKKVALDHLQKFEMELYDTGILSSIPELVPHLREMKSLLS